MVMRIALLCCIAGLALSEVYFKEEFNDESWKDRWVNSQHRDDFGEWKLSHGKFHGDKKDLGLQTGQDARFYSTSAKFPKQFSNKGKTVVIQYSTKHEQGIDCGGGYVKVMTSGIDQKAFHGETPYNVMFGPDICGSTKKVHVILNYKGKNHLIKKDIRCKDDVLSHLYTLILKSDNSYEVQIDGEKVADGKLEDDWDLLAPKKIKDPEAKKPDDWVDKEYMDDPEDSKPENWDQPKYIPDAEAKKPDDWDVDIDAEWEPPLIDNPEFKGEWKPKQIKNPKYKGAWMHPEIDNPEYKPDDELYLYEDWGSIGIDIWQVKSGTIFDNIIVTDSVDEAKEHAAKTFKPFQDGEKKMKDKSDAAEKKAVDEKKKKDEEEAKKKEEEEKAKKKDDDDEDGEDDDDDDEDEDDKKKAKDKKKKKEGAKPKEEL